MKKHLTFLTAALSLVWVSENFYGPYAQENVLRRLNSLPKARAKEAKVIHATDETVTEDSHHLTYWTIIHRAQSLRSCGDACD